MILLKKRCCICIAAILFFQTSFTQSSNINGPAGNGGFDPNITGKGKQDQIQLTGTVTDLSGNPISGASIKAGEKGTKTNEEGKYILSLNPGNYTVIISFVGYTTATKEINLTNSMLLDIVLSVKAAELDEVFIMTGSRAQARSKTNTALPVDVLSENDLKKTAQVSFDKQLQYKVPSFNTINVPVNDGTTLLDPYEIRNLGPNRTLVLINGKRKNLSSLLYLQFSPGRGETGADLSGIPIGAIKKVEILRDGASAQYGSDAIAGVMNIILKDKVQYNTLTIHSGITHEGDGINYGLAYNGGSTIGESGFFNYTFDFSQQNTAVRSGIIDPITEKAIFGGNADVDAAIDAFLLRYPTANNRNGTGQVQAAKFNYNLSVKSGENGTLYSNAALVFKKANSFANYRPPYWRTDAGLLHTPVATEPNYTGTNDPLYNGYIGYIPHFDGDLLDYNGTIGYTATKNKWKQDVSITIGGNQQLYTVENTVNRSLGTGSPTFFKPGGYSFSNIVGNFDLSKPLTDNISIAFGTEIRSETYNIIAGDTASYSGEGANSFPGIREENATTNSRFNLGAYIDASWDITNSLLLNGAFRTERYSDFGSAAVWKVSSRYKLIGDKTVLRASLSTGFRAPTLHQIFTQSTIGTFVGGLIQLSGLFNNRSKQAFLLGIPTLKPEKSTNFTAGIGLNPHKNFSMTLDYYDIGIKDRIVYSSSISSNNPSTQLYQILQQAGVKTIQFFINGIETRTQGLDLVASYHNIAFANSKMNLHLAGNYQITNKIVGEPNTPPSIAAAGSTILNSQIKSLLTESRPKYKFMFGIDEKINKLEIILNNTLFGPTRFQDLDNGGAIMQCVVQEFKPAVVTDLNLNYDFSKKTTVSFAINNLFNVLPKWELIALDHIGASYLSNAANKNLLEGFLAFGGRYRILGYNGSQFSQLGTIFQGSIVFKF